MIAIIVQIVIGVTLLLRGLSGFLHLVAHLPARCIAQQSVATIFFYHYLPLLFGLQLLGSLLLLFGRWKVLALMLLGSVILNIVLFHVFMGGGSLVFALLLALLECLGIWACCRYFRSAFVSENQLGPP
jgi:hypothetical protein